MFSTTFIILSHPFSSLHAYIHIAAHNRMLLFNKKKAWGRKRWWWWRPDIIYKYFTGCMIDSLDYVFFICQLLTSFSYLSPPLMNSPTLRSCNLLGRSSRSKCSIRSGSSWPRLPAEPLICLFRRLEMLVKLKQEKIYIILKLIINTTAEFQLVFGEEPCSWALNK